MARRDFSGKPLESLYPRGWQFRLFHIIFPFGSNVGSEGGAAGNAAEQPDGDNGFSFQRPVATHRLHIPALFLVLKPRQGDNFKFGRKPLLSRTGFQVNPQAALAARKFVMTLLSASKFSLTPLAIVSLSSLIVSRSSAPISMPAIRLSLISSTRSNVFRPNRWRWQP